MRKIFKLFYFGFMVILFNYCTEEEIITSPTKNEKTIEITSLSHSTANQGDKITVNGYGFESYENLYVVKLNNEFVESHVRSDSAISLFLPYNSSNGKFKLNFISPNKDTVIESPEITIGEKCPSELCIEWNNKETILEEDSWLNGWLGDTVKWEFEKRVDTVIISRRYSCGDECSMSNELIFIENNSNELPKFEYGELIKREFMLPSQLVDTFTNGVIKIDQWDKEGIYSGTFVNDNHILVFWVKKSE